MPKAKRLRVFAQQQEIRRFPKLDFEIPIAENQAFLLHDTELRKSFKNRHQSSAALYDKGQPEFDLFIDRIGEYVEKL